MATGFPISFRGRLPKKSRAVNPKNTRYTNFNCINSNTGGMRCVDSEKVCYTDIPAYACQPINREKYTKYGHLQLEPKLKESFLSHLGANYAEDVELGIFGSKVNVDAHVDQYTKDYPLLYPFTIDEIRRGLHHINKELPITATTFEQIRLFALSVGLTPDDIHNALGNPSTRVQPHVTFAPHTSSIPSINPFASAPSTSTNPFLTGNFPPSTTNPFLPGYVLPPSTSIDPFDTSFVRNLIPSRPASPVRTRPPSPNRNTRTTSPFRGPTVMYPSRKPYRESRRRTPSPRPGYQSTMSQGFETNRPSSPVMQFRSRPVARRTRSISPSRNMNVYEAIRDINQPLRVAVRDKVYTCNKI